MNEVAYRLFLPDTLMEWKTMFSMFHCSNPMLQVTVSNQPQCQVLKRGSQSTRSGNS